MSGKEETSLYLTSAPSSTKIELTFTSKSTVDINVLPLTDNPFLVTNSLAILFFLFYFKAIEGRGTSLKF
jgi:hypothetical protein